MPTPWDTILSYARRYPSPHNTQPIKLRIDGLSAEIFYDLDLGLPAGDAYGIPFGSVAAGIFIETVSIAAHSLGYSVAERLDFTPMDFTSGDRLHPLGVLTLEPSAEPIDDLAPDLLLSRRTSRLRYEQRPVPPAVMDEARRMAGNYDQTLAGTSERRLVDEVIAVNQRTLFYDLEKPAMREEIQGYLRYSERQARTPGDGLSARCLGLPGPLLRVIMGNYWVWKIPVLSAGLKQIYLRSMRGVAHVAWMKGPFANERDYTVAGRAFLRVWLLLSSHGLYLHPFGSVITNPRSHRELVAAVGEDEGTDMIWMLFRVGYSAQPPESHRRELRELVLG
ncbi:MAG: hypothetical protein H0W96_15595 [Solirubrobacterales bacterium]|nr:hypothetical protein [Solirubrobacterales bacterium]